ncbi:MAG: hypothetical protein KAH32_00295 [Chlamydiia bacterium]|nr:hypothetical protein [Chlamydiia bacterium]
MKDFANAFPVEEALKTLRADQLNSAVKVGNKLTVLHITMHVSDTHEEADTQEKGKTYYYRVAGELAEGNKKRRVQIPLASLFGAKIIDDGKTIDMIEYMRGGDDEKVTLNIKESVKDLEIKSLVTMVETNTQIIDTLGDSILRETFAEDGTAETDKVHARFAMADHKDYATLKAKADRKKRRVSYVDSAMSGVSANAKPLRQLIFTK